MSPKTQIVWDERARNWHVYVQHHNKAPQEIAKFSDGNLQRRLVVVTVNQLCASLMSTDVELMAEPAAMERAALTRLQRAGLQMVVIHS